MFSLGASCVSLEVIGSEISVAVVVVVVVVVNLIGMSVLMDLSVLGILM